MVKLECLVYLLVLVHGACGQVLRITRIVPQDYAATVEWSTPANIQNVRSFNVELQYMGPCTGVQIPIRSVRINDITVRSQSVDDLEPFSMYRATVAARDQGGPIEFVHMDFTTLAIVPTAPPHNVRAISANTTSITVAWDPVPCIERNSEIVDYRVRLLLRHSGAVIVNGVNTGAELGYTATGLLPGTSYNFRVDSVSVGNILGTMAGLLSYDTPLVTTMVSSTSAAVTVGVHWVNPPSTNMNITAQYLGPCAGVTIPMMSGLLDISTAVSTIISGLEQFSLYRISVAAAMGAGISEISVTNITTPSGAPSEPPLNIHAVSANTTSITVAWDPPSCPGQNGEIVDYSVRVTLQNSSALIANGTSMGTAVLRYTATGLHPGTSYLFLVDSVSVGVVNNGGNTGFFIYDTRTCHSEGCRNGGTCATSSPACACLPGFTGTLCETGLCVPGSCLSGDQCITVVGNSRPSCTCSAAVANSVRLVNGTTNLEGRVEICINGFWGTVCDDHWNYLDAIVVCRELGHNTLGAISLPEAHFGLGGGDIVRDDVRCSGSEASLLACPSLSSHDCIHEKDAAVQCQPSTFVANCTENALRLAGNASAVTATGRVHTGRVEFCRNGIWGTVCDNLWDTQDATVVCAQLGFQMPGGNAISGFGGGTGLIYLDEVRCLGNEVKLNSCVNNQNHENCDHSDDAGVSCILGPCDMIACSNGGTCVVVQNDGVCMCRPGFTGATCAVDIDFCQPSTCSNGGMCVEGPGTSTSCTCFPGFTGATCGTDMDYCLPTTCNNGGMCVEGTGISTTCLCSPGFSNVTCEEDLNFCLPSSCQNGGMCIEGRGTMTFCNCSVGFTGDTCEEDLNFCLPSSCQNGGMCIDGRGTMTSCNCSAGFTGDTCEVDLEFCSPSSCQNGGMCIEERGTMTSCNCLAGFTGDTCEVDMTFCQFNPCSNGGTCLEGRGAVTTCICVPGFTGSMCETDVDYCATTTPCRNGGTCVEGVARATSCICAQDFTGPMCSTRIEAEPVPCPAEVEENWMLSYAESQPGVIVTHLCSEISASQMGMITRVCLGGGEWGSVDTFACRRAEILEVEREVEQILNMEVVDAMMVEQVLQELVVATTTEETSLFPQDLGTTTNILDMTVGFLMQDLSSSNPFPLSTTVVEVIDNILEPNNEAGWQAFEENEVGSEMILSNAESYGQYFVQALMNENVTKSNDIAATMAITGDNIVIQAEFVDQNDINTILFPTGIDVNQRDMFGSAQSILPRSFLLDRGASEISISAVNIRMDNINAFLPNDGLNSTVRPATSVMATQLIQPTAMDKMQPPPDGPKATFRFTTRKFGENEVVSNPLCAFWDFADDETEGFWSQEGVTTEVASYDKEKKTYDVVCKSNHLTSFAVMLDVNMALSKVESDVLTIITYIGCSISIIFLVVTIFFFILVIGKTMFTSVHYFIHLNLAIALLLGYVVFLAGIDTAVGNRIGCAFVAGLLHYLFTAVFCWMLCEGIMLYLMLVVVFSNISKKWWLFFLLGWVPPIFIVAISVGIIHNQYGTDKYCWISVNDPKRGAIWAFAVPMLVVILMNIFFLVAALCSLYKVRRSKMAKGEKYASKNKGTKKDTKKSQALFKQLFMATVVLLPLLGMTWVFGLLSVNRSTTFFAWIFTILNSLQGLFIFIFHVLRSDKVWNKLCRKKGKDKPTLSTSASSGVQKDTSTSSIQSRYGVVNPRLSTTSFGQKSMLERVKEEHAMIEEKGDDNEDLLDVDLDMFADDIDSIREGKRRGEETHPALYYTVTLNWVGDEKSIIADTDM